MKVYEYDANIFKHLISDTLIAIQMVIRRYQVGNIRNRDHDRLR